MPEKNKVHCMSPSCAKTISRFSAYKRITRIGGQDYTAYYCSPECAKTIEQRKQN